MKTLQWHVQPSLPFASVNDFATLARVRHILEMALKNSRLAERNRVRRNLLHRILHTPPCAPQSGRMLLVTV
jgi:hypothetical protein